MAKFDNLSGGDLILPDGKLIPKGAVGFDIADDMLKCSGVDAWKKSGAIAPVKPKSSK